MRPWPTAQKATAAAKWNVRKNGALEKIADAEDPQIYHQDQNVLQVSVGNQGNTWQYMLHAVRLSD